MCHFLKYHSLCLPLYVFLNTPTHKTSDHTRCPASPLTRTLCIKSHTVSSSLCVSIRELKSRFSSVSRTEAHDTSRPRSLEALLCTCISCNYNLTGKHIHSHGFRVPEQNNKLATITHICGSAWLNPCCTVSSSHGGHFPELLHQC